MSDVAIITGSRGQGAAPPTPPGYQLWHRIRWIGYILLGLQLVGYLVWSVVEYQHFALTSDFSQYNQAWYLVAHGNLDPYSTAAGVQFWRNDAEFYPYVLAPLYWVFPTGITLQWAQDFSIAGAELVAFTWLGDLARRHCTERDAAWLAAFGLLLFLVNPWLWSTVSFDVHEEPLSIFFAAFLAWDLSRGKRRVWIWVVLVMLGGAPTTTYVMGIGLGGLLAGRQTRRAGATIAAAGFAYLLFLHLVHGNGTAAAAIRWYLAESGGNPLRVMELLWAGRTDIIANLAPAGLVGFGMPLLLPLVLAVIVPGTLLGIVFAEPVFQNVPLYVFLPVGTVAVFAWLLRRRRWAAFVLASVVAAQAIGWAAVWGPRIPAQWVRITSAEAATLASVQARIPASAEVVASQGVFGRLSGRPYAYPIFGSGLIPLRPDTWCVITPTTGIETVSTAISMAVIGEVAGPLHGKLITHANGVWVFRVTPSPGISSIDIPWGTSPLPAWAAAGIAGRPELDGPEPAWHMAATGATGYVADGIAWQIYPGRYQVGVTLSASAPIKVELWDDTTNKIVTRRTFLQTDGVRQAWLPLTVPRAPDASVFSGWGPFRTDFAPPPAGQRIEVRVWSPGRVAVNVYSADLTTASGAAVPDNLVPAPNGVVQGITHRNAPRSVP
jgi:Predicted membrane protein (DUF2079)